MIAVRFWGAITMAACIAIAPLNSASAISASLAKKCRALTAKQYPPRQIGNPAAGSAKGTGKEQLGYYQKCLANGGKTEESSQNGDKAKKEIENSSQNGTKVEKK